MLGRTGGAGLEPHMVIYTVTLYRDQPGTGVGSANLQLHFFTRLVVFFAQGDLQFCIAVQRAAEITLARHAVFNARQNLTILITQLIGEAAGGGCG